ncbi:MAG: protein BatD [Lentimicrobiaceae bacterium]|jgi:hypothetical protein|nr:protein BatD [Lentimicrobiaceae bacterium]MCP4910209.1 protein BatD [Bacteroidota bacterium]MBT3453756.1 protein BatD [Lentimicrobiaceae bacterium]MBT3819435.1 protein BatD [Lentimicrobiaceae bacterium]MBT4062165.1 protein BatD [Lentimicrobiaceae bacterium]
MIKSIYILALLLMITQIGYADDQIRFVGSSKKTVAVGERFRVVYEINQDAGNFMSPNFGDMQLLSGPSTSTNSSVQWINGKMTQSYSKTFTFILRATKEGQNTISPASAMVNNRRVQSNSLTIRVVKNPNSQKTNSGNVSNSNNEGVQDDDIYLKASITNSKPYLGEQILVTYKIYTKVPVSNLIVKKLSSFQGFWSKSLLDNKQQYKQTTEIINGQEYVVAVINQFAIFPQKTGKLIIEPTEMECEVQLRVQNNRKRGYDPFEDFFNDPFFNRNVKNIRTVIKSNPISIEVKPLPQKNKPANFNGAVGDFRLSSKIDRTELKANDALTLTYTISGKGNLELFNMPNIKFPVDFETFDPKISSNIKTSSSGVSGRKKFEYLVIPRVGGNFIINPFTLSYFDPKTKKYRTIKSKVYEIKVEKGEITSGGISYSSSAQEDIQFIGQDIRHIKPLPFKLYTIGSHLFLSATFFTIIVIIILLMTMIVILIKRMEKRKSNTSLLKNRKANKIAKTRLRSAEKFKNEGDDKAYYDEIAQALWGYIGDKFSLKQYELSIDSVSETLKEKGADNVVTETFINILNNIEFARFAPGDSSNKMESIYNESVNAIMLAEKALK